MIYCLRFLTGLVLILVILAGCDSADYAIVVTAFTFRCHTLGPSVYVCAPFYPMDRASDVITIWRDFMATAPDVYSSSALFWTIPNQSLFPQETRGQTAVGVVGLWCGDPEEGDRVTTPLRKIGNPLLDFSGVQPYLQVQTTWDAFFHTAQRSITGKRFTSST